MLRFTDCLFVSGIAMKSSAVRNRRKFLLGITALTMTGSSVWLSACGSGSSSKSTLGSSSGASSTYSSSSSSSSSPIAPTDDVSIIFPPEDARLVFFRATDGTEATYYGIKDGSGSITDVTGITYTDSSGKLSSTMSISDTLVTLNMLTGDSFIIEQSGSDYIITIFAAASTQSYSTTLSALQSGMNGKASKSKAGVLKPTISERIPQLTASRISPVMATATNPSVQGVLMKISNHCGVVQSGFATASIRPDSSWEIEIINNKSINLPKYNLNLNYVPEKMGFYGEVPVSALCSTLTVAATDVLKADINAIINYVKEKFEKDGIFIAMTTAISALILLPETIVGASIFEVLYILAEATQVLLNFQTVREGLVEIWQVTEDAYKMVKGTGTTFPIVIDANYEGTSLTKSGSQKIAVPGAADAVISIALDATSHPSIIDFYLVSLPTSYLATAVFDCDNSGSYFVNISVSGTDGYSDSLSLPLSGGSTFQLSVPTNRDTLFAGASDSIKVTLTQNGTIVDELEATITYSASSTP